MNNEELQNIIKSLKIKNYKPCGEKVLIELVTLEEKTKGGIVLPDEHRERERRQQTTGIIRAIGPTAFLDMVTNEEDIPKVGTLVHFLKYAGITLTINEKEYQVINDDEIFIGAIIND